MRLTAAMLTYLPGGRVVVPNRFRVYACRSPLPPYDFNELKTVIWLDDDLHQMKIHATDSNGKPITRDGRCVELLYQCERVRFNLDAECAFVVFTPARLVSWEYA